jgi:FAD/FMN-containing dehydrogenase
VFGEFWRRLQRDGNLVRGCVAGPGEIGLSLERMHRIESVDPVNRIMTLEAGVPLEQIAEHLAHHKDPRTTREFYADVAVPRKLPTVV